MSLSFSRNRNRHKSEPSAYVNSTDTSAYVNSTNAEEAPVEGLPVFDDRSVSSGIVNPSGVEARPSAEPEPVNLRDKRDDFGVVDKNRDSESRFVGIGKSRGETIRIALDGLNAASGVNGANAGSEPGLHYGVGRNGTSPAESQSLVLSEQGSSKIQINLESSPATISHLHAALEHQIGMLLEGASIRNSALDSESPSIIGVTSAIKGEGKSTVALHLAMSIARDSFKRVCLIDLSLDDDSLSRRLDLKESDGIVQVLEGTQNRIPTLGIEGFDNLAVIPGGGRRLPVNPARIARSPHVMEIIAAAREMFDLVIVDLPAVSTGNALPLASQFDAVIMVVNAGVTPKQIVNDALDYIGRQRTLGVVLNRIKPSMPRWLHNRFNRAI